MPGPLDGIRILDFTRFQQGTFGTAQLGDLGADIWKIEQPGGDPGRTLGRHLSGYSSYFESLNRNKRSISLDLRKPEGIEVVRRLAEKVDIVAENFRPGTMEKLGIGYDDLKAINHGLIFASGSMYGPLGPRGRDPGYDNIAQATGGLMAFTTEDGEVPHGAQPGIADQTGGAMLSYAILAALVHRLRSGEGQKVDVSLYGSQIALQGIHVARVWNDHEFAPPGKSSGVLSHRALCIDGRWIAFGFLEARHFPRLATALGLEELATDPSFATAEARGPNIGALVERIDAQVIQRPADEWIDRLREADIPCTVVHSYEDIRTDEQAIANGYVHETDHPVWGKIATHGPVAQFSASPASVRFIAPVAPGDHSHEILEEGGFTSDEIAALTASGAVLGTPAGRVAEAR
ncbi:MAG: CoA transferase [Chloroflexi bacterium]|nr:CoA transferase [Chloroflexota bacterium]MDA1147124.1 CoA transferase [Chloroflexota bacterium]